jgi:hypothetical protein
VKQDLVDFGHSAGPIAGPIMGATKSPMPASPVALNPVEHPPHQAGKKEAGSKTRTGGLQNAVPGEGTFLFKAPCLGFYTNTLVPKTGS